jgi:antitoxin component YwqK of YwqJK toxin-antitoxin module
VRKIVLSALFLCMIVTYSCNHTDPLAAKPYKFPENVLDSLVDIDQALVNVVKMQNGKVQEKKFFLADTVCYDLVYNKFGELISVYKFNGKGIELWQENYYPNGQRMSHFEKASDLKTGESYFNGFYEAYYEFGEIKERGVYKNNELVWMVPFTKDRVSGDTIQYEIQQ